VRHRIQSGKLCDRHTFVECGADGPLAKHVPVLVIDPDRLDVRCPLLLRGQGAQDRFDRRAQLDPDQRLAQEPLVLLELDSHLKVRLDEGRDGSADFLSSTPHGGHIPRLE